MSAVTPANVFLGTGRRKTSTARVRVTEGTGKLTVNGRSFDDYFSHENFAKQAYAPLLTVELRTGKHCKFNINAPLNYILNLFTQSARSAWIK